MTLVVSLRIPDGVVLAADSLQTTQQQLQIPVLNPKTNLPEMQLLPAMIPTSTSSYAQKLFSFKGYGVATYGSAIINKRTIYNHIKTLESNINKNVAAKDREIGSVTLAANTLKEYFEKQLTDQLSENQSKGIQTPPDGILIMGLQVVGYESLSDEIGKTLDVHIITGNRSIVKENIGLGCTVSGDWDVVKKLWEIGANNPQKVANYNSFSLRDAIDYAEFLINTQSMFQRFANMIPTVGGEVDIAMITTHSGFKWIKYKSLTKIIESI